MYGDDPRTSGRGYLDSLRSAYGGSLQPPGQGDLKHAGGMSPGRIQPAAARTLVLPLFRSPRWGQTGGTPPLADARAGESAGPKPKPLMAASGRLRRKTPYFENGKTASSWVNKTGKLELLTK